MPPLASPTEAERERAANFYTHLLSFHSDLEENAGPGWDFICKNNSFHNRHYMSHKHLADISVHQDHSAVGITFSDNE